MLKKKICILNPYLPTLGGGEKYMGLLCDFIEKKYCNAEIDILVHSFNEVDVYSSDYVTIDDLNKRFGIFLEKTKIRKVDIKPSKKLFGKLKNKIEIEQITKEYDLFIDFMFLSKHIGRAKKNIYICMFPANRFELELSGFLKKIMGKIADIMFIKSYNLFITISLYTNHWLNVYWGKTDNSKIIYPPVLPEKEIDSLYNEGLKKNIVLSVGRFFVASHCKRQLEMVKMFVNNKELFKNYEYHLVGAVSTRKEDIDYLNQIKEYSSKVDNVFVHENYPYNKLVELYKSAKIFWHATGYGIDENKDPEKIEHFGISTVEAMAYGVVPVVINKGGQKEVVDNGISGYVWNNEDECIKYTLSLMEDEDKRKKFALNANLKSKRFSYEQFYSDLKVVFDEYKLL